MRKEIDQNHHLYVPTMAMATISGRDRIITAVRIRPLNEKEIKTGCQTVVSIENRPEEPGAIVIIDPTYFTKKEGSDRRPYERQFTYDYSFWSVSPQANFATQLDIFQQVGAPLIEHCMNGLNCSILAYGQTGSGKTYTMIGYDSIGGNETGVVPRLCTGLLRAAEVAMCNVPNLPNSPNGATTSETDSNDMQPRYRALSIDLNLSYYEIYNERVYDLLSTQPEVSCRVRESREDGAYVENLTKRDFVSFESVALILEEGNRKRSVAATLMNSTSSRSHAGMYADLDDLLHPHNT